MENLQITENMKTKLLHAMKQLNFLNYVMVAALVFYALIALAMLFLPMKYTGNVPGFVSSILYVAIIAIYYYPLKKSFLLVKNTREALNSDSQMSLEEATDCFDSVLTYYTNLTKIGLLILAVFIVFVIISFGAFIR